MRLLSTFALALLTVAPLAAQSAQQLNFYSGLSDGREIRRMLYSHMKEKAARLFEERRRKIAQLSSAADVHARRQYLREKTQEALGGPFPPRTPLNARVVGVLDRDDYRIEKIVFESQPRFFVTANLYLPKKGRPPYPGILFPLGHEAGAKAHEAWQQILSSFAKKGFVALAWEPVGQGERVQLYDKDFENSKVVRSTTEHTIVGIQCLLMGDNLARYTIWDGLRALDYLLSRPEVDSKRIGCTGNSGGGTHTAYISALDDRIQVAAPSCYITSWERLLATIGPQDAEQCLPPWLADGLDHPDFIHAFAPKPFLILSAIRDFFSIYGARSTYGEAKRIYDMLGAGEKVSMVEADDGHGYSKPRRLASYRWFSRWLKGVEDDQPEPEVVIATPEELLCTETGQVATSLGGETVHSLNLKRLEEFRRKATPFSAAEVQRMVGYEKRDEPLRVDPFGNIDGSGYRIEKLVYESEPGIRVPSLLYLPEKPAGKKAAAVFIDGRGKAATHDQAGQLAKAGMVVLSIDARGFGETRSMSDDNGSDWPRYFGDYNSAMTALLTGKPLVAMRAEDVTRGVDLLAGRAEVDEARISVFGKGAGAVPALYAAAFDERIRKVALEEMLVSYEAVVTGGIHRGVFENIVRGALRYYDLPDLVAWLAPRPVRIVDAVSPMGELVALGEVNRQYARAASGGHLRVVRRKPADTMTTLYGELLD
jgi:cephalosporin-C deacetylase-like acetyl esterase